MVLSQKICSFLLMPPSNTPRLVFITTTPGRRKLPISAERFLKIYFSPTEKGKIVELKKMTKIKLVRVLLQILINSTIFATFNFWFLFCFAVT